MSIANSLARNPAVGGVFALTAVGAAVYYLFGDQIAAWFKGKFDPTSHENLAYRGVSAAVGAVTGAGTRADGSADPDFNLGGWIYDALHPAASNVVYLVTFPDGARHAVSASDVTGDRFTRGGVAYQLRPDPAGTGKFAVPIGVKQTGGATGYW